MSVFKRKYRDKDGKTRYTKSWYYDFWLAGVRYKEVIPKARIKSQAKKAEIRIKDKIFAGTYGAEKRRVPRFSDFVKNTYTPYAREHKRSVNVEAWRLEVLNRYFGSRRLDEIDRERVERFKSQMHASITQYGRQRTKKGCQPLPRNPSQDFHPCCGVG
jgi:hypothetical protein